MHGVVLDQGQDGALRAVPMQGVRYVPRIRRHRGVRTHRSHNQIATSCDGGSHCNRVTDEQQWKQWQQQEEEEQQPRWQRLRRNL